MTSPVVVVRETQTVVLTAPGPQGPPGPAGGIFYYRHDQLSPSASWVINHNLGAYPSVSVIIDGAVVWADVSHGSLNQTSIVLPTPETGVAIFS